MHVCVHVRVCMCGAFHTHIAASVHACVHLTHSSPVYIGGQTNSTDLVQMTALHHACLAGTTSCVEWLLQDPATTVDCQDISGCTPLLYCFKNKNKELEQVWRGLTRVPVLASRAVELSS